MREIELVLLLLVVVTALTLVARRLTVPYPIVMVLGGRGVRQGRAAARIPLRRAAPPRAVPDRDGPRRAGAESGPGLARLSAATRPRVLRVPSAVALRRRLLHVHTRIQGQSPSDHPARIRSGDLHGRRCGRGRA